MTNKEIVQDLLRRIPDDTSLQDIARELDFIAAVRQGHGLSDSRFTLSTFRLDDRRQLIEVIRFWHAGRGTPEII